MTRQSEPTVHIVDDDDAVRDALGELLNSVGFSSRAFASANEFLPHLESDPSGCILLDVRMPGIDGLQLHQTLLQRDCLMPVIFVTSHGDVPMAVDALHQGAFDFIEKPWREQTLLDSVRRAMDYDAKRRQHNQMKSAITERLRNLSQRERQVLDGILRGQTSKAIALNLGLSRKTVDQHRAHVMAKMAAENIVNLVCDAMAAGICPEPSTAPPQR